MSGSFVAQRPEWAVYGRTICGDERRLDDLQRAFTFQRRLYV
jgi:hypothetical protein